MIRNRTSLLSTFRHSTVAKRMIPDRMCAILLIYCYCDNNSIFHILIEMKKNFLVLIMATIMFLIVKTQTTTSKPKYPPDHRFQVCGKHLSGLLAFVCDSRYNTPLPTKFRHLRSIADTENLSSEDRAILSQKEVPEGPKKILNFILSKEDAQSLLLIRRRRTPGVYDECCRKSCAYKEIVNYCAAQ